MRDESACSFLTKPQKYGHAIAAFKEGLKICKDEPQLQKGLAAAKNAKMESSKARKAVQRTQATRKATRKRQDKAKNAKTVSSFVQQTRKELKMQMAAIQAQLDLINELADMTDDEKLDLLFSLIDADGNGLIDTQELATDLRKRNEGLGFIPSLEKAADMVQEFDKNGDSRLNHEEFNSCIVSMCKDQEIDLKDFSEYLVLQILFKDSVAGTGGAASSDDETSVLTKEQEKDELIDMLTDKRLIDIFKIFDKDGSRKLPFSQVATGLYKVTLDMDESVQTTMRLLLMMEKKDRRSVNFEQFGRLVMSIVAASNTTFDDMSDDLMISLTRNDALEPAKLKELIVSDELIRIAGQMEDERKKDEAPIDALSYGRLQRLFDIWDVNGDGTMTPAELHAGLRKFQSASHLNGNAKKETAALLGFDADGTHCLGRREFAKAMVHYAKSYGVDLHVLIDFMAVATVLGEKTGSFQSAYGKALNVTSVPDLKSSSSEDIVL